jgi:hypothetical protein
MTYGMQGASGKCVPYLNAEVIWGVMLCPQVSSCKHFRKAGNYWLAEMVQ